MGHDSGLMLVFQAFPAVQLILLSAGIVGTIVMGYVIPTGSREEIEKECAQEPP